MADTDILNKIKHAINGMDYPSTIKLIVENRNNLKFIFSKNEYEASAFEETPDDDLGAIIQAYIVHPTVNQYSENKPDNFESILTEEWDDQFLSINVDLREDVSDEVDTTKEVEIDLSIINSNPLFVFLQRDDDDSEWQVDNGYIKDKYNKDELNEHYGSKDVIVRQEDLAFLIKLLVVEGEWLLGKNREPFFLETTLP